MYSSGIACSNPAACTPGPDASNARDATWNSVRMLAATDARDYSVCYCPGRCVNTDHYVNLAYSLSVPASSHYFSLTQSSRTGYTDTQIDRYIASFHLTVSSNAGASGYSSWDDWNVRISDGPNCASQHAGFSMGAFTLQSDKSSVRGQVTVTRANVAPGKFYVCFCSGHGSTNAEVVQELPPASACGDYEVIPGSDAPFLSVLPRDPQDSQQNWGVYTGQRWSVSTLGSAASPFRMVVKGHSLTTGNATLKATRAATCAVSTAANEPAFVFTRRSATATKYTTFYMN